MPHLILEYTANAPDRPELDRVLERLHAAITTAGPFDPANVKSRVVRLEQFRVADGAPEQGFVHLSVAVLAGREAETLRATGNALLAVLQDSFPRAHAGQRCQITVEIREMRRELYFKAVPPSAGGAEQGRPPSV
jgi:5-carboxymethyl-2-hydroxymuconate isomerase